MKREYEVTYMYMYCIMLCYQILLRLPLRESRVMLYQRLATMSVRQLEHVSLLSLSLSLSLCCLP